MIANDQLKPAYFTYLEAGGEMGELTRSFNWSDTVLGDPSTWSQSLLTTVGIILKAKFPMFLWWGDELIQFYNDAYRPSLGNEGKHPKALGQHGEDCWPEIWPVIKPLIDQVMSGGESHWSEDQLIPIYRNGHLEDVYWTFSYSKVNDEPGKPGGVLVVCSETTDKVLARQRNEQTMKQLEKAQDLLQLAIDSAGIGTWTADIQTGLLTMSPRTRNIHGIPDDVNLSLTGSYSLITEEFRSGVIEQITKAVDSGQSFEEEYYIQQMGSNRKRWVRSNGKTYYDDQGKPAYITGSILDMTEQKEDDTRKNDFIAMASHELKTPLTSLSGLIQLMFEISKKETDSARTLMLDKADKQVKKMTNMINGFLNVSRLESGKIHLHITDFDLVQLIRDVIGELSLTITSHVINFECNKEIRLQGDREKIESVIVNLLNNAIKYSPDGKHVIINCNVGDNIVTVSVADNGIGIFPGDREKLFERFYRGENRNSAISGFGVGLYLCAEIIRRHSGQIWVESEFGQGSTFYFSLPGGNS